MKIADKLLEEAVQNTGGWVCHKCGFDGKTWDGLDKHFGRGCNNECIYIWIAFWVFAGLILIREYLM